MKLPVVIPVRSIGERRQGELDQLHAALQEVEEGDLFCKSMLWCQVSFAPKGFGSSNWSLYIDENIRGTLNGEKPKMTECFGFE